MRRFFSIVLLGIGVVLSFSASAKTLCYDLSSMYTYGNVNQNDPLINGGATACGPTSAINSFIYLQNRFGITGLVDPQNPTSAVNTLSAYMKRETDGNGNYNSGVTIDNFVNGKINYIHDKQTGGPEINVHYVALTHQSIYDELVKGQDLEMWIDWPTDGAHYVTLTSICWDDNNNNNIYDFGDVAKKLDFIDPWGGGKQVADIIYGTSGWYLHYTGGAAGTDGSDAYVKWIVAESPVPLPPAAWTGLAMLGLVVGRVVTRRAA
jgi:hypothetical protein